jgi:ribose 5-phosphate isomerase A
MNGRRIVTESSGETRKRIAGCYAADLVEDGTVIGLGTGSTMAYAMERLAARIHQGLRIRGIPTSFQAEMLARTLEIPLTTLDEYPEPDMALDGADQVDEHLRMIKGRGAALTREKIMAAAARELIIVVDESKWVPALNALVPVEVIPFALRPVILGIQSIGGEPVIRTGLRKDGPVITDNGNFILDCSFGSIDHPEETEGLLSLMPGVLSCGLFCEFVDKTTVILGGDQGCREITR